MARKWESKVHLAPVICEAPGCITPLVQNTGKGGFKKYCSVKCRNHFYYMRSRGLGGYGAAQVNKPQKAAHESLDGRGSPRVGPIYEQFLRDGPFYLLDRYTHDQIATLYAVDRSTVTRWVRAYRADMLDKQAAKGWAMSDRAKRMLEPTVEAFCEFWLEIFPTDRHGKPTRIEWFHREWAQEFITAYLEGTRAAVAAPPRHGKSELLVALMVWVLVRDPNAAIIWVARSQTLAKRATRRMLAVLEHSDTLKDLFLPPGANFRPPTRSGTPWTVEEATVATRTIPHKATSVTALGAGSTLLSLDADIVIGDDFEDDRNTGTVEQREGTAQWFFKDLESRKEAETGLFYIGSRQHPDDLLHKIETNPGWKFLSYSAHRDDCAAPWDPHPEKANTAAYPEQHKGCVLFEAVRPFSYIYEKYCTLEGDVFEMQYLQRPRPHGTVLFPRSLVEDARDRSRALGAIDPSWDPHRLIASWDPSGGTGWDAAILWQVNLETGAMLLVDAVRERGGGLAQIRRLMAAWHTSYGVAEWSVEMNTARAYLYADNELAALRRSKGIIIYEHKTNVNKLDLNLGVPSLATDFKNGRIVLPYGDERSRIVVNEIVNQFVNFQEVSSGRHKQAFDFVMACWFPVRQIRGWIADRGEGTKVGYTPTGWPWQPTAYPTSPMRESWPR